MTLKTIEGTFVAPQGKFALLVGRFNSFVVESLVSGAVDTLVYDFTVDVLGRLDNETGDLTYVDDGYDLLSRIAVWVLQTGGRVIPVRSSDVISEIWNGTATARLRYPLSQ